jgi:hypothetical protein
MAVDMEQVRAALLPEEPDYPEAARKLGAEALPHLEKIVTEDNVGLAAKAAYLAGLIGTDKSLGTLQKAARNADPVVRVAAAAAARHLPNEYADALVLQLVDDADTGVHKVALRSAPTTMSDALKIRVDAYASVAAAAGVKAAKKPTGKKSAAKRPAGKKSAAKKPRKSAK